MRSLLRPRPENSVRQTPAIRSNSFTSPVRRVAGRLGVDKEHSTGEAKILQTLFSGEAGTLQSRELQFPASIQRRQKKDTPSSRSLSLPNRGPALEIYTGQGVDGRLKSANYLHGSRLSIGYGSPLNSVRNGKILRRWRAVRSGRR